MLGDFGLEDALLNYLRLFNLTCNNKDITYPYLMLDAFSNGRGDRCFNAGINFRGEAIYIRLLYS